MNPLALPGAFDISAVTVAAAGLIEALAGGELAIDGRAVTRIDAAGLQLLCAAVATARTTGRRVRWVGASPVLVAGAATLGLTAALELPRVENS